MLLLPDMQRTFLRELASVVMKATVVVLTIIVVVISLGALYDAESIVGDGACNVAVLPVEGTILPFYGLIDAPLIVTPEMIESFMDTVEAQGDIDAVLVEINSPGGTPVASQRIAERLRNSTLPVVGLVGDIGASGGYMVAAASDYLVASPMSQVGSIGVTMSYIEQTKQNEEDGLTYVELNTGKFKDSGSPDRPLTDEEREVFQRDLDVIHAEFVNMVATYRNKTVEEINVLADGSSMTGVKALEVGLVDALGGRLEAKKALAHILSVEPSEISFCEYESGLFLF
jgi:protease-4